MRDVEPLGLDVWRCLDCVVVVSLHFSSMGKEGEPTRPSWRAEVGDE
jgi:hypothetical protein